MKTHEILFQTLSQADDYVNGEQLAQELGVSRTSIWKAIQRLEKDGVVIESLKKKGYKLVSGDILLPEVIASNTQLTVTFEQNQQTYQGLAKDISDTGQLLVQLDNQEEIWLNSGEVSLKQWNL